MEKIKVLSVRTDAHKIEVRYAVTEGLKPFFSKYTDTFFVEYSLPVGDVPVSVAVVPFVANVLPIVWLTDSILELDEIDKSFYESIDDFKKGYVNMYPQAVFGGKIKVCSVVENEYPQEGSAMFFSGGADAYSTLVEYRKEYPMLLSVIGADITLDDKEGIFNQTRIMEKGTEDFQLPDPCLISSNFRSFIQGKNLDDIVRIYGEDWWHGFQHGIGLICLSAPIAFHKHLKTVYIASTNVKGHHATCASDGSIDNYVRFGSTQVVHAQFEKSRQQKIALIVDYCKTEKRKIELRVCWRSKGGHNCCHCEKCYRTIFAIVAEGGDPKEYGFNMTNRDILDAERIVKKSLYRKYGMLRAKWQEIVDKIKACDMVPDSRMEWILSLDPYHPCGRIERKFLRISCPVRRLCRTLSKKFAFLLA